MGHTAVLAIKASWVTLSIWQNDPDKYTEFCKLYHVSQLKADVKQRYWRSAKRHAMNINGISNEDTATNDMRKTMGTPVPSHDRDSPRNYGAGGTSPHTTPASQGDFSV